MRERPIPIKREHEISHLKVDSSLMRRIRDSKVVIFRAVCDGRWDKTRVAILDNTEERCRHRSAEVEVEMKLSEFYQTIRPGKEIVFYERHALEADDGEGILFKERGEPAIYAGGKAVFRVDIIACNDRFRQNSCLIEGPANDME